VTVTCRGPEPETAPTHAVKETPEIVSRCTITVDGLDVTAHAVRCRAGLGGWVEVYRTNPDGRRVVCGLGDGHFDPSGAWVGDPRDDCPIGGTMNDHAAVEFLYGNVELSVDP
jgi:hypothetical protein